MWSLYLVPFSLLYVFAHNSCQNTLDFAILFGGRSLMKFLAFSLSNKTFFLSFFSFFWLLLNWASKNYSWSIFFLGPPTPHGQACSKFSHISYFKKCNHIFFGRSHLTRCLIISQLFLLPRHNSKQDDLLCAIELLVFCRGHSIATCINTYSLGWSWVELDHHIASFSPYFYNELPTNSTWICRSSTCMSGG